MPEQLPLFPLHSVLFPHGRMSLRVFEPRYLDLVRVCFKNKNEFGVVLIRDGSEAAIDAKSPMPKLAQIGCLARIVDWGAPFNGSIGITVEGGGKFRVLATQQQPNYLIVADIERLPPEVELPLPARASDLVELLRQLIAHPLVARLNLEPQTADGGCMVNQIAQLLPIPEVHKFALLAESNPSLRLDRLLLILDQITD
ncbi:MAG TPA: LON peptidase substrate-binding domain-containing protein [Spongiibacteraceae bacterium]|jgi:hypothetical protein